MRQKYSCVIPSLLQGFKVLGDSMELAIQETKAFLENLEHKEILVNGAKQGLRGFVMFQYVIRPTTSGNITAKDPTSDNIAVWEGLL